MRLVARRTTLSSARANALPYRPPGRPSAALRSVATRQRRSTPITSTGVGLPSSTVSGGNDRAVAVSTSWAGSSEGHSMLATHGHSRFVNRDGLRDTREDRRSSRHRKGHLRAGACSLERRVWSRSMAKAQGISHSPPPQWIGPTGRATLVRSTWNRTPGTQDQTSPEVDRERDQTQVCHLPS